MPRKDRGEAAVPRVLVRCLGRGAREHWFLSTSKFHRICSDCVARIDKKRPLDPTVHDSRRDGTGHVSADD